MTTHFPGAWYRHFNKNFNILDYYFLFVVYREEEEYEESDPGVQSTKSNNPRSVDENNQSQAASVGKLMKTTNHRLSVWVS